ncbi:MAG: hypothetical protein KIT14_19825 [bacterium]|nr:hypothetical protein [bacterium]
MTDSMPTTADRADTAAPPPAAEYASEDSLVQSDQAVVEALIATYKALGGGWDAATVVAQE